MINAQRAKRAKTQQTRKAAPKIDMGMMPGESNISKTFTERTTKVVIVLILSTLFCLPLME